MCVCVFLFYYMIIIYVLIRIFVSLLFTTLTILYDLTIEYTAFLVPH